MWIEITAIDAETHEAYRSGKLWLNLSLVKSMDIQNEATFLNTQIGVIYTKVPDEVAKIRQYLEANQVKPPSGSAGYTF
jgi:hypothetical protein